MAPTPNIHESHQAELNLQQSAENPPRAAGITVDDDNDTTLDVPYEYPPQTNMINPSGAALALNGHFFNAATSQGNPFFGASPQFSCHPTAKSSHLAPNTAPPWDVINSEGVVDAMSQPSLQQLNTMGAFGPYVDATHHQHHDGPNQYHFVTPANNLQSKNAPFHVEDFYGTSSGFQLPLDMSGATVSQDVGNLNSNGIGENWNLPTNSQPDFSFTGAGHELLNSQTNYFGVLSMSYQPYAHPVLAPASGAFHQYPAPPLLQGYAPTENRQLEYNDPSSIQTGSTGVIGPLSTAAQDIALHDPYESIIAEGDGHSENMGHIQPFRQSESINSLVPLDSLNTALTGHDGVYDLSGNILPDMQQPTDFVGQNGDAGLNSHSHSLYPARVGQESNDLSSSFAPGYEMVSWATGPPSTDVTLRQREPTTQLSAPYLKFEPQSSAEIPINTALVAYGPGRPPQNPSRQVSKRSRKMPTSASESRSLATQKKREERKDRQLSRFASRTRIPEDRIGAFGECTRYTVQKRGKGTQKAARKRGTCTRCHLSKLRCDDAEGECCNNCKKYWATLAAGCTNWRWTRDCWKALVKEFLNYCRSEQISSHCSDIDKNILEIQTLGWSTLAGLYDFLSEPNSSRSYFRYMQKSPKSFSLWVYACPIMELSTACSVMNPKMDSVFSRIPLMFLCILRGILTVLEKDRNMPSELYAMMSTYALRGVEESPVMRSGQFGPWLLQAITILLKISLCRLTQDGGVGSTTHTAVFCVLNEWESGRALVPKEFHSHTWGTLGVAFLQKMATSSTRVICVDPRNHERECWCGLLLSSIPLDVMRFFGIEDEKDENELQWHTFVAKHCTWMHGLGKTDPHGMIVNGRWKRSMRRIFTIQLQKVLKSVLEIIEIWQDESVLKLTHEELMIDCEYWQHRMFSASLHTTAEYFLATISGSPREDTIRANPSQEDVFKTVKPILFKILLTRKFKALETKNGARDIHDILGWMKAQIAKLSSRSATT